MARKLGSKKVVMGAMVRITFRVASFPDAGQESCGLEPPRRELPFPDLPSEVRQETQWTLVGDPRRPDVSSLAPDLP